ncbi:MAG: hypothetical protein RTU09_10300 [Candidatus Thorarchaeota archaeon]
MNGQSSIPAPMMVLMFGFFLTVIGPMIDFALSGFGIVLQLVGIAILAIVLPISMLKTKSSMFFPPCASGFLMAFAGFAIIFQGIWLSFPHGDDSLGAMLTMLGLVYIIGGAPIMYLVRKRKSKSTQSAEGISVFDDSYVQPPQFPAGWGSETVVEREVLLTRRIPPKCHKCGADVNPEEVDWIGPDTVRCAHCGASLVVTTERL